MYKKFILSGFSRKNSDLLNNKLKLSNQIAVILTAFCLLNSISLGLLNAKIIILPIAAGILAIGSVFMRAYGELYFSRFLLSIAPMLLLYFHKGVIYPQGDQPEYGFYMLVLTVSAFPFMVFDLNEKRWQFPVLALNVFILFTIEYINNWIDFKLDVPAEALHSSSKAFMVRFTSIIGLFAILLYLIQSNRKALLNNEALNEYMQKRNEKLLNSEKELKEMLDELEKARLEDSRRSEISQKSADFAQLLRMDSMGQQELYDQVISYIVKNLGANQGGLYLAGNDSTGQYLSLKACYAYNRKKFIDQRIEIGEGLLGQAFLEQNAVYLTEVPEDYINITSGLGEALPTCIVIMPMIYQEKVVGLIELASFKVLEAHQVELLQKISENLASMVTASNNQLETRKLLERSQLQAEELQSREEELRQNMEELQGTQEEMSRREKVYLQKIKMLEEENHQLKESVLA